MEQAASILSHHTNAKLIVEGQSRSFPCATGAILAELIALTNEFRDVSTHVIFVHGLSGHPRTTWASNSDGELWPIWLHVDDPRIGVWTIGFDAAKTRWEGFSMPLQDRAENVLPLLLGEQRIATGTLILVGHSLGGLVIKQILRSAERQSSSDTRASEFLTRVRSVAFLATPHQGASLASAADLLRFFTRPTHSTLALVRNNPSLRDLNVWYRAFSIKNAVSNLVLAETRVRDWLGLVVKPDSSDPGLSGVTPIPVDADHIDIAKPANRDSEVYKHIADFVRQTTNALARHVSVVEGIAPSLLGTVASAISEQREVLNRLEQQAIASAADIGRLAGWRGETTVLDSTARARLSVLIRSRYFVGYMFDDVSRLAKNILEGDLCGASAAIKSEILAWCSRLIAASNRDAARTWLNEASSTDRSELIDIADAVLIAAEDGLPMAVERLAPLNTTPKQSVAYILHQKYAGLEAAETWLEAAKIQFADLNSDAQLVCLHSLIKAGDWRRLFPRLDLVQAGAFDSSPALNFVVADALVASVTPTEMRSLVTSGNVYFDMAEFPLSDDAHAITVRRRAQSLYRNGADAAKSLGMDQSQIFGYERALWLALRDPEQKSEARKSLVSSLRQSEQSLRHVPLALQFGIEVDLDLVEREIERADALSGGTSPQSAFARFALVFKQKTPGDAAAYLAAHKAGILKVFDPLAVGCTEVELLAQAGQRQTARTLLNRLATDGLSPFDVEKLGRIIDEQSSADAVDQRLARFESTQSLADLRALLFALRSARDWQKYAHYAGLYFEQTHDNTDAGNYAHGLYQAARLPDLFSLLNAHPNLERESDGIRMLKAWALFQSGDVRAARDVLVTLPTCADTDDYRNLSIGIAIYSGDWESLLAFTETEWAERDQRSKERLIRAARLAQMAGSPRTRELTQEAARRGQDDANLLLACHTVAREQGWEESQEVAAWFARAWQLSDGTGPVQTMRVDELVARQPKWEEHAQSVRRMVAEGRAPMFVAADALRRSLLNTVLSSALINLDIVDTRRRESIYAFSGIQRGIPVVPRKVALDATSLLNCAFLGITETILTCFEQVYIPHSTLSWLFDEHRQIRFHQPSRVMRSRQLRRFVDTGSLRVFDTYASPRSELVQEMGEDLGSMLLEATAEHDDVTRARVVVRSYPIWRLGTLMREEIVLDAGTYKDRMCSCQAVVDKLFQRGHLTESATLTCIAYLDAHGQRWPEEREIDDQAILYLDALAMAKFQQLDLLGVLASSGMTIYVARGVIDECDRLIEHDAYAELAVKLSTDLRLCLKRAIESGRVRLGPSRMEAFDGDEYEDIEELRRNPTFGVFDICALVDAVVVDDRALNLHPQIASSGQSRPVLTTLDLIEFLVDSKRIAKPFAWELKTKLRRAGLVFVPLVLDELTHYLSRAVSSDGNFIETAELRAVRQSVLQAAMSDALRIPSEQPWLANTLTVFREALRAVWRSSSHTDTANAKSDWIVKLMDVRRWGRHFAWTDAEAKDQYRGFLMSLVTLVSQDADDVRRRYWKWLDDQILWDLKLSRPAEYNWIVRQLSQNIRSTLNTSNITGAQT